MLSFTRRRLVVVFAFLCCAVFALAKFGPVGKAWTSAFLVPAMTATNQDSLPVDVDGDGRADPGDTVQYTVVINNSGTDATAVSFTEPLDANMTLVAGSVHASPLTVNDTYPVAGNIRRAIPDGATDLLANDINPQTGTNAGLSTIAQTISSTNCTGTCTNNVVIAADGSFSYNPPPGFVGTDTFTYNATDGTATATGTATMTVSGMIWFVNSASGTNGDGRLTNPFNCLRGPLCFDSTTTGGRQTARATTSFFITALIRADLHFSKTKGSSARASDTLANISA